MKGKNAKGRKVMEKLVKYPGKLMEKSWKYNPSFVTDILEENRRISLMPYQSKSLGKTTDFVTLTLCISLTSNKMCTYFCKDLVTGYCLYLVES